MALQFLPALELPCTAGSETPRLDLPVPGTRVAASHPSPKSIAPSCRRLNLLLFLFFRNGQQQLARPACVDPVRASVDER